MSIVENDKKNKISDQVLILIKALQIRRAEQLLLEQYKKGGIKGTIHTCIGQEIISVLLSEHTAEFFWFSNHRGHGHYLAKTNDFSGLFSEILVKERALTGGIGGSQHIYGNLFMSNGIQGGQAGIATGYSSKFSGIKKSASVIFIGDGTLGAGHIYESWNLASLFKSNILFVLEDNAIAQSTPSKKTFSGDIKKRAEGFGLKYLTTTDSDIFDLTSKIIESVKMVKSGEPTLLHIHTKRLSSHSKGDDNRSNSDILELENNDLLNIAINNKLISFDSKEIKDIELIFTNVLESTDLLYSQKIMSISKDKSKYIDNLPIDQVNLRTHINNSLSNYLDRNPNAIIIGEDIEDDPFDSGIIYGGAFKVTKGLSTRFPGRVVSMPISESGFTGFGTGIALSGSPVIIEIMFADFLSQNYDQLFHQISKIPSIYGKNINLEIIIRVAGFSGNGYGPTHSSSMEGLFLGLPNIIICVANQFVSYDSLLDISSVNKKPLIILEPKSQYLSEINPEVYDEYEIEITESPYSSILIKPKNNLAVITLFVVGPQTETVLNSLKKLAVEFEIFLDVFIPTLVSEVNLEKLGASLNKTCGKLLIIDESIQGNGIGSYWLAKIIKQFKVNKLGYFNMPEWLPTGTVENSVLLNFPKLLSEIKEIIDGN